MCPGIILGHVEKRMSTQVIYNENNKIQLNQTQCQRHKLDIIKWYNSES